MRQYVVSRMLLAVPTLLGITLLTFFGLRMLLPTNVVDQIVGEYGRSDPALKVKLRHDLGLDSSVPVQYVKWMGHILRGDFGKSLNGGRPVSRDLRDRLPVSIELGTVGLLLALLIAVPAGVASAVRQDHWPDYVLRSVAILLSAIPGFWIALMIITFGSIWFNWAPPLTYKSLFTDPASHIKIMLLPAILVGLTPSAGLTRLVRTLMLEVLREDYVRTARAKGLASGVVLVRHALRNTMIPLVTVVGITLPNVVAGTVIFETIFGLPGMGRYLTDGIRQLDYPIIQGTNLIYAMLLVLAVLVVDLSYSFLDPRIRLT
jgi:peptide/nickel transport system permease protein